MNKVIEYIRESREELLHKVTWPSWSELQGLAIVVVVATMIISLLIFGLDYAFGQAIREYYKLFN